MTATCEIHGIEMEGREGQYGMFYSHLIPDVGYCNGKKISPLKRQGAQTSPQNSSYETKRADLLGETKSDVMTRVDWNNKDFTEGLRALSYDYRKEDRHPTDTWATTHLKEWMRTLYGDYEGYPEWEKKLEVRVTKLAPKTKEEEMKDYADDFFDAKNEG